MGRSSRKTIIHENLLISDLAAEGKAIAKKDDLIIFVSNCIPGDIVDVRIQRRQKNFQEGYPVKFHQLSTDRIDPFCEHFGICGGCKWQNLPYPKQLEFKQRQVEDQFKRIGHLKFPEPSAISPSNQTTHYRNKLEYTFSNLRWLNDGERNSSQDTDMRALGFHIPKMFDRIVDINTCFLQKEPSNEIRLFVKALAIKLNLAFYNQRNHSGEIRNLIIRTSTTGDLMIIVVFASIETEKQIRLLLELQEKFQEITSLNYVINTKKNDSIHDLEVVNFSGKDHILERMEDLSFRIGPKSFYQTNSEQAYKLYQIVRDFAQLKGNELVYDLYAGTGTIGLFLAKNAKTIIGVENIAEAIEDAKKNAQLNKIEHAHFYTGDIKDLLDSIVSKHGIADVIIVDPPRAGLHPQVADKLSNSLAKKIIYVSCNPATQARDLEILCVNYHIKLIQAVDMFPHTHHVENVVLLEKN